VEVVADGVSGWGEVTAGRNVHPVTEGAGGHAKSSICVNHGSQPLVRHPFVTSGFGSTLNGGAKTASYDVLSDCGKQRVLTFPRYRFGGNVGRPR